MRIIELIINKMCYTRGIKMKKLVRLLLCFIVSLSAFACFANQTKKYDYRTGDVIKEVIPCIYDNAFEFSEGLAAVELNGKRGYISYLPN